MHCIYKLSVCAAGEQSLKTLRAFNDWHSVHCEPQASIHYLHHALCEPQASINLIFLSTLRASGEAFLSCVVCRRRVFIFENDILWAVGDALCWQFICLRCRRTIITNTTSIQWLHSVLCEPQASIHEIYALWSIVFTNYLFAPQANIKALLINKIKAFIGKMCILRAAGEHSSTLIYPVSYMPAFILNSASRRRVFVW